MHNTNTTTTAGTTPEDCPICGRELRDDEQTGEPFCVSCGLDFERETASAEPEKTRKYTRQDYMSGKVTHRQYYGQFVTPDIKRMVIERIGLKELQRSRDEHLNDIPLGIWDALAGSSKLQRMRGDYSCTLRIADDNSLASQVCTLKEAAKQIKESEAAQ